MAEVADGKLVKNETVISIEPYESSLDILPPIAPDRVMFTARRNGELVGHLCLTQIQGAIYGHDTKCWDEDKYTAARLWLAARKFLRSIGIHRVYVHVTEDSMTASLWENRGFKRVLTVLEGEI